MAEAKLCAVEGCGKKLFSRGVCHWHYKRLPGKRLCTEAGCERPEHGGGLCSMHNHRRLRHGSTDTRQRPANGESEAWIAEHIAYDGDGCLIWPFWRDKHGYGRSREMCEAAHGPPPTPEHQAAHSCGKGHEGCVHPRHLRWATRLENQAEMVDHGNSNRGEKNPMTPLTEVDVREIRRVGRSIRQKELADRFGVTRGTIRRIQKRETWGWLE